MRGRGESPQTEGPQWAMSLPRALLLQMKAPRVNAGEGQVLGWAMWGWQGRSEASNGGNSLRIFRGKGSLHRKAPASL